MQMTTRLPAGGAFVSSLAAIWFVALALPALAQIGPRAADPLPERWPDNVPHDSPDGWSARVDPGREAAPFDPVAGPVEDVSGTDNRTPAVEPAPRADVAGSSDEERESGAVAPAATATLPEMDDASLFERGIGAIEAGKAEQGQRLLEQLVARAPATPLADEARRRLARIYAERYAADAKGAGEAGGEAAATGAESVAPSAQAAEAGPNEPGPNTQPPPANERETAAASAAVAAPVEQPPAPWRDRARRSHRFEGLMSAEVGDRIFFGLASSDVGSRARTVLERQARWIRRFPDLYVVVEGHADDPGDDAANRALSLERAMKARQMLIDAGVSRERIDIDPRGRQDRLADCTSAQCQAQNRRVLTRLMVVLPQRGDRSSSLEAPAAADGAPRVAVEGSPFAPGPRGDR